MANEKSKAEIYRDERKARIAATAKKNAKNMEKRNTAKKLFKKVVSIVIVAAIVLGAVGGILNYYGVWERAIPLGKIGDKNLSISMAEYQYYYQNYYSQFLSEIQQYGEDYDTTLTPDKQISTTTDAGGNEITWEDAIRNKVIENIQVIKVYYNEAVKAGMDELSEQDQATIEEQVKSLREAAESTETSDGQQKMKYTVNAYLRQQYGGYMTEKLFREMLKENLIASNYYQNRLETLKKECDDAKIKETYEKDKDAYDLVDFRYYEVTNTAITRNDGESEEDFNKRSKEAEAKAKKDADELLASKDEVAFLAKVKELNKDDESYDADAATKAAGIVKESVEQSFSEEVAEWLYDDATKTGSKKMFTAEDESTYNVYYVTKAAYQTDTVNVRHILFSTKDLQTGADLTDDEIAQKKKDAEACLKEWQNGDKTEDSFAELAAQYSEDTGSSSNGGLYSNVVPNTMVKEFNAWIFDANRKAGDVEIVETDYGYHVIYFVSAGGQYYDAVIRAELAEKQFEEEATALLDSADYQVGIGPRRMEYVEKKLFKQIKKNLAQQAANSSSSYSY